MGVGMGGEWGRGQGGRGRAGQGGGGEMAAAAAPARPAPNSPTPFFGEPHRCASFPLRRRFKGADAGRRGFLSMFFIGKPP